MTPPVKGLRTAAWQEYWDNPLAPHPDRIGGLQPVSPGPRPPGQGHCHHYRQPNEHYHSEMQELEICER